MEPKTPFNFDAYLRDLDSQQSYKVERLTGGIVNEVVRASKQSPLEASRFRDHSTLILKHAEPYVAARGPSVPLSLVRQSVEASALSLFLPGDSHGSLYEVTSRSDVSVPTLLHHDTVKHVLVISDLGPLPSMTELVSDILGGSNIYASHTVDDARDSFNIYNKSDEDEAIFSRLGCRFGCFFALLHSPSTLKTLLGRFGSYSAFPCDLSMREAIFHQGVEPTKDRLALFPQLLADADETADHLFQRVEADFRRDTTDCERAFTLGDPWPSAMLCGLSTESNDPLHTGIIDWEFAGIGRGVNVDFAAVLAHFALYEITAEHLTTASTLATALLQRLRRFRAAMVTEYCLVSRRESAMWSAALADDVPLEASDARVLVLRSAMISHAVEMIRCAVRRKWKCGHSECVSYSGELDAKKGACSLIQRMVSRAIWYLQNARDDGAKFCKPENWAALKAGRNSGFWFLDIFF